MLTLCWLVTYFFNFMLQRQDRNILVQVQKSRLKLKVEWKHQIKWHLTKDSVLTEIDSTEINAPDTKFISWIIKVASIPIFISTSDSISVNLSVNMVFKLLRTSCYCLNFIINWNPSLEDEHENWNIASM